MCENKDKKNNSTVEGTAEASARPGYSRLFPELEPFLPSNEALDELAKFLARRTAVLESDIPAGYTYLSQFITHDLSHDSKKGTIPIDTTETSDLVNLRTPFFDLETLYGHEELWNDEETLRSELLEGLSRLKVGETVGDGSGGFYGTFKNDLWRPPGSSKAAIVDQRNDENLAVAQTQVSFARFHNAIVDRSELGNTTAAFEAARRSVIRHYQWIVLYDFLPRIVKETVLEDIRNNGVKLFPQILPEPVELPLEFPFGALRFGHSMVAHLYQWNRLIIPRPLDGSLANLGKFTYLGGGLKTSKNLQSRWVINWKWFYDINNSKVTEGANFNRARKIDTLITPALGNFRGEDILEGYNRFNSLPALDLYRNRALRMPSGQSIARRMVELGIPVNILTPDDFDEILKDAPENVRSAFREEAPLSFYVLAEAETEERKGISNGRLGDVGGRIIAETIIKFMELSPFSILNEEWEENEWLGNGEKFGMAEMLSFVGGSDPDRFLNPTIFAPDPGKIS